MRLTLVACLLLALTVVSPAQDPRGSIVGRVSDSTGAMIPDIEVQAANAATGVKAAAKTSSAGTFTIPYLLPGFYTLSVESAGFKKFVRDRIEVRVTESVDIPITLEIGAVTETVRVVAEAPVLATTDATQGTVIEDRAIVELPLLGGNPVEFALLDPAVMNETDMRERRAAFTNAGSQWSSMGAGSFRNEFQIDGVSNTFAEGNGRARVAFNPPPSSIGQFKIVTNPFDASAGNSMGATLNVSTKAGTNDLHGEGHYYNRNAALDTMDFFYNKRNTRKPVYGDHRFGASVGGPIYVPKLFNGKNRTFFFYAWDMSTWGSPQSYTSTVPTAAQRTGDFSGLLDLGAAYQIYDPFTTRPAATAGRFERDAFPGNIVPKSRFDTAGFNMANLYPLPNQPGNRDGTSNYFRAYAASERYWVHLARFDHAFSQSHRLFVRINYDFWEEHKNEYYDVPIQGITLNRINRGAALDDVILLTPNLVLNIRYGLTQQDFTERRITSGIDLGALGFSQGLTKLVRPGVATLPRVTVGAYTGFSIWESGDGASNSLTHNFNGTLSTQRGIHSLRWGADFRAYRSFGNRYPLETSPQLTFGTNYTRGPNDNSGASAIGQDMASMLMGIATAGDMENRASFAIQTPYLSGFLQDDVKLTQRLTVNLGVRWEMEWPMTERFDRMVTGFDFNAASPIEGAVKAAYARAPIAELPADQFRVRGGLQFATQTPTGRGIFYKDKNNFMPRIGMAWQVRPRTTVRTGYGIFYGSLGVNNTDPLQYGFSQGTPIIPTLDNGQSYPARASNPFPNGLIPAGRNVGLSTYLGQAIAFDNQLNKQAYSQRWTLAVQQLMPTQTTVEAAYVGNRGTHLNISRDINATPLQYLSTSTTRDATVIGSLGQTFPNPFLGQGTLFTANTMSRANLLRPYPQYTGITMDGSDGYSWYHSLQIRAARRWNRGISLNAGYAWTKMMEATQFLTAGQLMPYETLSGSHRPHRLTFSAIWELPFGKGRAVGKSLPRLLDGMVGRWQLSGVVVRQAGPPLTWGNIIFSGDPDTIALPKGERDVDRWFNTDAGFNKVANQALASNIRYFPMRLAGVEGDGQSRWDISLSKGFRIHEQKLFRLRLQCFNIMNHPNFGGPQLGPTNAQFGQITGTAGIGRSFQMAGTISF